MAAPKPSPQVGVLGGPGARVLLVGTGQHRPGSQLPTLGSVSATVTDLAAVLVECCGVASGRIRTVADPASPLVFGEALHEAAAHAQDVLLVCFVGHGLLDADGELYLATGATDHVRDRLEFTAVPYATLRKELDRSPVRQRIVILDCCFSGQAGGLPAPHWPDGLVTSRAHGGYVLASAAPEESALSPPDQPHTMFTGELIRLLREGDPAGPPSLTLDHLYRCLDRALASQHGPRPHRYATGQAGELVLAPNPAYQPPLPPLPPLVRSDGVCPYRGLAAYDVADADYFFGREALTELLVAQLGERLRDAGMLVVVGASGSGKSSLLRAGLIPALETAGLPDVPGSGVWPKVVLTPGARPLLSLARQLAPHTNETPDELSSRLGGEPAELCSTAEMVLSCHTPHANCASIGGQRLVIVVDQFEEVFTTCEDDHERQIFLDALTTAASSVALVVLGLRADFYARCAAESQLVDALQHNQLIVTPMKTDELRAAIEQPARKAGLELESGLVERVLQDLGASHNENQRRKSSGLPFLSYVLFETWRRRQDELLTLAGYEATGGIWEAVTQGAEQCYDQLTKTQRDIAQTILLRMVRLGESGVEDTRRQVSRAELPTSDDAQRVLNVFAEARLVSLDQDTVEIAHEALLRAWPRLREWIETDRAGHLTRQRLEEATTTWDRNDRDPNLLYRGSMLHSAREWATTHPDQLSPTATEFLAAAAHQESRSKRVRRFLFATLTTLALLAVGAASIAFQLADTARQERDNAIVSLIAVEADRLANTDVSMSAQLYLTAHDRQPENHDLDNAVISKANGALSTSIPGTEADSVTEVALSRDGRMLATSGSNRMRLWNVTDPVRPMLLAELPPDSLAQLPPDFHDIVRTGTFSPDERTLVTAGIGGMLLWNITDPTHPTPIATQGFGTGAIQAVAFSPDGRTLASADNSLAGAGDLRGEVRLWNLTDAAHPTPLAALPPGQGNIVSTVLFSADRHTLVTTGIRGTRLWNITDPTHPTPLTAEDFGTGAVRTVGLSPDGHTLASASDKTARLWNVTDPTHPTPIGQPLQHTDTVNAVAFSPDGHTLASAGPGQPVRIWNVPYVRLTGHTQPITAVAFSPDRRTLASAGEDKTVRLWNVADPTHPISIGEPLQHTDAVWAVAFSPDGHTLATAGWRQPVQLWNVTDPTHPTPLGQPDHGIASALAFSPDGHTLASAGAGGIVQLSNVADPSHPTPLGPAIQHSNLAVNALAFSPNGRTLASASNDTTVQLWSVADPAHPTQIGQPLHHTGKVTAVAFSPNGHTLASTNNYRSGAGDTTGGNDTTVRLWNVADPAHPTPIGQPLQHTDTVNAVAFSPDGHTLATAGRRQPVQLWNVADPAHPTLMGSPLGSANTTNTLAFRPDGRTLASAGDDHTTWLWEVDLGQAMQRICSTTPGTLTPEKWRQYMPRDLRYDPHCQ